MSSSFLTCSYPQCLTQLWQCWHCLSPPHGHHFVECKVGLGASFLQQHGESSACLAWECSLPWLSSAEGRSDLLEELCTHEPLGSPTRKKSKGVRSGDLGGHSITWFRAITRFPNKSLRRFLTIILLRAGAPSCAHQRCLNCPFAWRLNRGALASSQLQKVSRRAGSPGNSSCLRIIWNGCNCKSSLVILLKGLCDKPSPFRWELILWPFCCGFCSACWTVWMFCGDRLVLWRPEWPLFRLWLVPVCWYFLTFAYTVVREGHLTFGNWRRKLRITLVALWVRWNSVTMKALWSGVYWGRTIFLQCLVGRCDVKPWHGRSTGLNWLCNQRTQAWPAWLCSFSKEAGRIALKAREEMSLIVLVGKIIDTFKSV